MPHYSRLLLIDIPCCACRAPFRETVQWFNHHESFLCAGCGATTPIHANDLIDIARTVTTQRSHLKAKSV